MLLMLAGLLLLPACAPVEPAAAPAEAPQEAPAVLPPPRIEEPPPSTDAATPLQRRVEAAIRNVRSRSLLRNNAFWTVFHGILGLGPGVELVEPKSGRRVNALDYVCDGGELRGLSFQPSPYGVDVITMRDSQGQGHQDQFIAEMAQWGMPADRRLRVQGRDYAFRDFVRHSQMRARTTADQELSWTVMIVAQYVGTDAAWTNERGEKLRLEDLVRYELDASVEKAACGGTHRLFGLSWTYHLHLKKGGKTEGVWKDVAEKTARYAAKAKEYQNADGSLSTESFEGRGSNPDRQARINTTGHVLEWLALALSDEELKAAWVQEAVSALSLLILDMQDAPIDSGSMYHAVHGLYLYHVRAFGGAFAPPELMIPLPPGWKTPKR
jgi:hypothetical protein